MPLGPGTCDTWSLPPVTVEAVADGMQTGSSVQSLMWASQRAWRTCLQRKALFWYGEGRQNHPRTLSFQMGYRKASQPWVRIGDQQLSVGLTRGIGAISVAKPVALGRFLFFVTPAGAPYLPLLCSAGFDLYSSLCSCLPQPWSEFVGAPQVWVPVRGPGANRGFRIVCCPQPAHHNGREAVELG